MGSRSGVAGGAVTDLRSVWVILPAYNETGGLPTLLKSLALLAAEWREMSSNPLSRPHVVVVDDGSTDETAAVAHGFADRLRLTVLAHPQNRGLAAAIRTGVEHTCREAAPNDVIVTMDADDTHRPEQLPDLVRAIGEGADVVIASRYARGARQDGVPAHRVVLSAGISWLLRLRFRLPGVRDYSCGYRAYRASVLQRALAAYGDRLIVSRGFVASTELLTKLAPFARRFVEVPLDLRYDRKVGPSKMPTAQTMAAYLRLMLTPRAGPGA
jgi:dolichol-phosphate mannosyltransferase